MFDLVPAKGGLGQRTDVIIVTGARQMSKKRHRCDHEGGCSVRKEQKKRGGQNPI